jgi:hypothetical protein
MSAMACAGDIAPVEVAAEEPDMVGAVPCPETMVPVDAVAESPTNGTACEGVSVPPAEVAAAPASACVDNGDPVADTALAPGIATETD